MPLVVLLGRNFDAMQEAREESGLTQQQVDDRMNTKVSAASIGQKHHPPSVNTLRKYAKAVGCDFVFRFVPRHDRRKQR